MGTHARRRFSNCGPAIVTSPSQSDSESIGSCGNDAAGEGDGRLPRPTRENADKVLWYLSSSNLGERRHTPPRRPGGASDVEKLGQSFGSRVVLRELRCSLSRKSSLHKEGRGGGEGRRQGRRFRWFLRQFQQFQRLL